MKQVKYRDFLRNPKIVFPLPEEGMELVRQEGNFYIYPVRQHPEAKTVVVSDKIDPVRQVLHQAEDKAAHLSSTEIKKGPCFSCKYFKVVKLHSFIWEYDPVTEEICEACWEKCRRNGDDRE